MAELTQLFDYCVLGTDTTPSILAAALARTGRKVIHLDSPSYFGSSDASLNFTELFSFLTASDTVNCTRRTVQVQAAPESACHLSPRRFSVDLLPKLIHANGEVVDRLIQSGVSDYLEFRSVRTGILWNGSSFEAVPCNKAEIFQASNITMAEKRLLMRFIETCQRLFETEDFDSSKDFRGLMSEMGLTPRLQETILYGVLLDQGGSTLTIGTAINRLKQYSESLGRYKDNKALLYPMYGSSDVPQAYCRLAAVFQAIYCLSIEFGSPVIEFNDENLYVMKTSLGEIKAKHVICGAAYGDQSVDPSVETTTQAQYFHGYIVSTAELYASEEGDPVLLSIPPEKFRNLSPIYILQLSSSTNTVAPDHFLYHVGFQVSQSDDAEHTFELLTQALPIDIIFRGSYIQNSNYRQGSLGVIHLSDVSGDFEFKTNFEIAQATFSQLEPEAEFLPKRKTQEDDETDRILEDFIE